MLISSSTFDAIHKRQAQVYNRGVLELILCILFDNTMVVTAGSIVDSPVLLSVFGDFLKATRSKYHGLSPLRLYIDERLHFSPIDRTSVVHKLMDAYLCGRAQNGSDIWKDDETAFPNGYNFAFMEPKRFHAFGRGRVLEILRDPNKSVDILEFCSPYIQENASLLNQYFQENPDRIGITTDVFRRKTYEEYTYPLLNNYADLIDSYSKTELRPRLNILTETLRGRGSFNRNQLGKVGREIFGEQWDEYFSSFLNIHYWGLLSELCGAQAVQNIELWNVATPSTRDSIKEILASENGDMVMDLWEADASETLEGSPKNDESDKRIQDIDWLHIVELRTKSEDRLQLIANAKNEDEHHAALEDYINFLAQELKPRLSLLDLRGDRFTVTLQSIENTQIKEYAAIGWKYLRVSPIKSVAAAIGYNLYHYPGMVLGRKAGEALEDMLSFYLNLTGKREIKSSNKVLIKKYAYSGKGFVD